MPYGYCWCGCGAKTATAPKTNRPRFMYKGEPLRFSRGHSFARRKRGFYKTVEHNSYRGMLSRCYGANHERYPRYGGRGITVCDRWRESPENFYADMGPKPTPGHSLDRIDNDGPYSPDNCRWATPAQQRANTSTSRMLTHNGKTMSMSEWSEETGVHMSTLCQRLKRGWSVDRALTT